MPITNATTCKFFFNSTSQFSQKLTDGCFIGYGGVSDSRILNFETSEGSLLDIRESMGARSARLTELSTRYDGKLTVETAQEIVSDHYDVYTKRSNASSRTICAHFDRDNAEYSASPDVVPFMPYGTVQATVVSTELAEEHTIMARWGSACGRQFDSQAFLEKHPQFNNLSTYLFDRPSEFWGKLYAKN